MAYTAAPYADIIRRLYVEQHLSLHKVARILNNDYHIPVTGMMVRSILRRQGIDTSKAGNVIHKSVLCRTCGSPKAVTRARFRDATGRGPSAHRPWHHYCDHVCFRIWKEEHCKGQRAARRMVEYIMDKQLPPEAVVHFIDDDVENVVRSNLKVFTTTKRHIEEHRYALREEEFLNNMKEEG